MRALYKIFEKVQVEQKLLYIKVVNRIANDIF